MQRLAVMATISNLGLAALVAVGLCAAYFLIFNLFFHPLRKFPGPKLAAITPIPLMYNRATGQIVKWIHALHIQHGPVVRIAPDELSFIEPEAWKDIYGHRAAGKLTFQKDLRFYGQDFFTKPGEPTGIVRADDVNHVRQRRLFSAGFSEKALREQEPLLKKYVDVLIEKLDNASQEKAGKANLVDWFNFTTFDIMADLTFAEPLHLLDNSSYSAWVRSVMGSVKFVVAHQIASGIPGLEPLLQKAIPKSFLEKKQTHLEFSSRRVDKRLAMKTERPDIWTYVLRFSNSEENKDRGLSLNEMYSNASTFMLAGTETTATLLSGLTYLLLKHPQRMERLVAELRNSFPTREAITLEKLVGLEYLNACIEEALRIYPPVPTGLPRITPANGAEICGRYVPAGTYVSVTNYAAYHSTLNFKRPDDFIPERWLPESMGEFADDRKQVLQPFLVGPRNCLGKYLAYHEIRLVLANVLWSFELTLCEESDGWIDQKVFFVWEKCPLFVQLTPYRRAQAI